MDNNRNDLLSYFRMKDWVNKLEFESVDLILSIFKDIGIVRLVRIIYVGIILLLKLVFNPLRTSY